jgi:hypothetical protein
MLNSLPDPGPHPLVLGPALKGCNDQETVVRVKRLKQTVEKYIPEFVESLRESKTDMVMLHQDAFASGYDYDEYVILGMAIKLAGLYGKNIHFSGLTGDTCKPEYKKLHREVLRPLAVE